MTLAEYLEENLLSNEEVEEVKPEKIAEWEADLENLVEEGSKNPQLSLVERIKDLISENLSALSVLINDQILIKNIYSQVQFLQ